MGGDTLCPAVVDALVRLLRASNSKDEPVEAVDWGEILSASTAASGRRLAVELVVVEGNTTLCGITLADNDHVVAAVRPLSKQTAHKEE